MVAAIEFEKQQGDQWPKERNKKCIEKKTRVYD